jgi:HSP20 family protein
MEKTKEKELVKVQDQKSWEESFEKEVWTAPLVDIVETDENFVLVAYMPGVSKENAQVKLEDDNLVLMGRLDRYNELKDARYIVKEHEFGNYYRKFNLSDSIDETKIEAEMKDGLLTVVLPKHERIKPKTIEIK